ncbi:MAG: hypothetical protein IPH84_13700 [Bacteroidales bacterium]|nr:hypothetical protein [Bacteroidales bacterium]
MTSIGGDLEINVNPTLTSLTGLNNIDAGSITNLYIIYNYLLSGCEVQSICDYLAAPNGVVEIYANTAGCNSPEEVEAACQVGLENSPEKGFCTIYPNPSPSQFTFEFYLQEPSKVNLVVHNGLGQVVATLADGELAPGTHQVFWNAWEPSGRDLLFPFAGK